MVSQWTLVEQYNYEHGMVAAGVVTGSVGSNNICSISKDHCIRVMPLVEVHFLDCKMKIYMSR